MWQRPSVVTHSPHPCVLMSPAWLQLHPSWLLGIQSCSPTYPLSTTSDLSKTQVWAFLLPWPTPFPYWLCWCFPTLPPFDPSHTEFLPVPLMPCSSLQASLFILSSAQNTVAPASAPPHNRRLLPSQSFGAPPLLGSAASDKQFV